MVTNRVRCFLGCAEAVCVLRGRGAWWTHPQNEGPSPHLWEADGHRKHPLFQASPHFFANKGVTRMAVVAGHGKQDNPSPGISVLCWRKWDLQLLF